MVDTDLEKCANAAGHNSSLLTSPPRVYAPNADYTDTNLASPRQAMQPQPPQLRARPRYTHSTSTTAEPESLEAEPLTPTSSVDHEHVQGKIRLFVGRGLATNKR